MSGKPADKKALRKKGGPDAFSAEPLGDKIGDMLRQSYQDVVSEGIPDDFMALLQSADDAAGKDA